jgi:hypothetical protein
VAEVDVDADVVLAMALLWMLSAIRVVGAVMRREVFGAEASLATVSLVVIPWMLFRRRSGRRREETLSVGRSGPVLRLVRKPQEGHRIERNGTDK